MGGTMMRAVVQRRYGGADTWNVESIGRPTPGRGEVLVRVQAAAIDRGTWDLMRGEPWLARAAFGVRRPRNPVPGRDLAGTVVEVGPGVTGTVVGDEVYGTGHGSLAEFAVAPVRRLAPRPAGCSAVAPVSRLRRAMTPSGALVLVGGIGGGRVTAR